MSTKVRIINKWTIEYGKLSKSRLCNVAKVGGDKAHNIRCAKIKGSIPWTASFNRTLCILNPANSTFARTQPNLGKEKPSKLFGTISNSE